MEHIFSSLQKIDWYSHNLSKFSMSLIFWHEKSNQNFICCIRSKHGNKILAKASFNNLCNEFLSFRVLQRATAVRKFYWEFKRKTKTTLLHDTKVNQRLDVLEWKKYFQLKFSCEERYQVFMKNGITESCQTRKIFLKKKNSNHETRNIFHLTFGHICTNHVQQGSLPLFLTINRLHCAVICVKLATRWYLSFGEPKLSLIFSISKIFKMVANTWWRRSKMVLLPFNFNFQLTCLEFRCVTVHFSQ